MIFALIGAKVLGYGRHVKVSSETRRVLPACQHTSNLMLPVSELIYRGKSSFGKIDSLVTNQHHGVMVSTPASYFGVYRFELGTVNLTEILMTFLGF